MELRFFGAPGTVTKHLANIGGKKILLDCGLFQGYAQLSLHNRAALLYVEC